MDYELPDELKYLRKRALEQRLQRAFVAQAARAGEIPTLEWGMYLSTPQLATILGINRRQIQRSTSELTWKRSGHVRTSPVLIRINRRFQKWCASRCIVVNIVNQPKPSPRVLDLFGS